MNLFAEIFAEYIDALNRAGFVEHLFLVFVFSFLFAGTMFLLIAAVIWSIWCLHDWWFGLGDRIVVEELVVPVAADVPVPQVGNTWLAQANHLRRRIVSG